MLPRYSRIGSAAVLWAGLVAGCQGTAKKNAYDNDPLVMSRKPVEGNAAAPAAVPLARAEPVPPPVPTVPPGPDAIAGPGGVAAQPVATLKKPVFATPAVRLTAPEDTHPPAPVFGHAPDLSWVQGVLDRHYQGHFELRYCAHTIEDRWGGKVRLEADGQLAPFRDGDVVRVEGYVIPEAGDGPRAWDEAPRFKVRSVRLVRRGD